MKRSCSPLLIAFSGTETLKRGNSGNGRTFPYEVMVKSFDFRRQVIPNVEHCVILNSANGRKYSGITLIKAGSCSFLTSTMKGVLYSVIEC